MTARTLDCIKTLRSNLVETLREANIDDVGDNIYPARVEKAWPEEEAFIVVNIPNIEFKDGRTSPRFYLASADLMIDIFAAETRGESAFYRADASDMADWLDDTAKTVCELLEPCNSVGPFGGTVKRCFLKSFSNNLSEGETMRGAMRIVFGIEFAVCINNSSPEDEFLTAENTLKMGDGDANQQEFTTNLRP